MKIYIVGSIECHDVDEMLGCFTDKIIAEKLRDSLEEAQDDDVTTYYVEPVEFNCIKLYAKKDKELIPKLLKFGSLVKIV